MVKRGENVLTLEGVSKSFPGVKALDRVDLLAEGSCWSIAAARPPPEIDQAPAHQHDGDHTREA